MDVEVKFYFPLKPKVYRLSEQNTSMIVSLIHLFKLGDVEVSDLELTRVEYRRSGRVRDEEELLSTKNNARM